MNDVEKLKRIGILEQIHNEDKLKVSYNEKMTLFKEYFDNLNKLSKPEHHWYINENQYISFSTLLNED
jgi:hypothetical protein